MPTTARTRRPGVTTVHLNGLAIGLDSQTGAIRKLDYPGPGTLLDADASEAGLVDAAYPLRLSSRLRLAARHGRGAVFQQSADRVVVCARSRAPVGRSSPSTARWRPTVVLRADTDKRSIARHMRHREPLASRVTAGDLPRVRGLAAVAGPEYTILKSCGFGSAPFRELAVGGPTSGTR